MRAMATAINADSADPIVMSMSYSRSSRGDWVWCASRRGRQPVADALFCAWVIEVSHSVSIAEAVWIAVRRSC